MKKIGRRNKRERSRDYYVYGTENNLTQWSGTPNRVTKVTEERDNKSNLLKT